MSQAFGASTIFSGAAGLFIFTLQGRVSATLPGWSEACGTWLVLIAPVRFDILRTTQIASLCYKLATTVLSLVVFPQATVKCRSQSWVQARKDLGWLAFVGYGLSTVSVALYACLEGCCFAPT